MSVTLERIGGKIVVKDPIRRQAADLLEQIPEQYRARVRQLLELEREAQRPQVAERPQ